MDREDSSHSSDWLDSSMHQREPLVEVAIAVGNVEAAGCSMANAVDSSKKVVMVEGAAMETGSVGTAVVDSKVAGSKIP